MVGSFAIFLISTDWGYGINILRESSGKSTTIIEV